MNYLLQTQYFDVTIKNVAFKYLKLKNQSNKLCFI